MANTVIAVRSSGTAAATPSLGVIANGEIALNFADGIIYYKTSSNTLGSIRTTQPAGLTSEIQFNDAGSFGSDAGLTYNKTTDTLTVTNVSASSVNVTNTTSSTSKTTGALKVAGGVGVAGDLFAGQIVVDNGSYGNVTISQFASVYGQAYSTNPYSIVQVRSNDFVSGMGMQAYTGLNGLIYSNTGISFSTGTNVRDKDFPTGGTNAGQFAANGAFIAQASLASTSNATGSIQVVGGIGVKGNVSANGIIFDDGTRQTTAATGGATVGDILALAIALG